jgi:hypothetical protein
MSIDINFVDKFWAHVGGVNGEDGLYKINGVAFCVFVKGTDRLFIEASCAPLNNIVSIM